jgi:DNA-binding NtrC family response regulator
VTDYHRRVEVFKKGLLEQTLRAHCGNRTYAARALGLQRTYLIRLIKLFQIDVPARGITPNGTRDC